jgi:hypothetical protein
VILHLGPARAAVAAAVAAALLLAGCTGPTQAPVFHEPSEGGSPTPPTYAGWSDPDHVYGPYGDAVKGVLTFRGNPTRTYYGEGPAPRVAPEVAWRFPRNGSMCGLSTDETGEKTWCGTGFTGQPAVFEREGRTWVVFGAYDYAVHFLDADTGERIIADFPTGDIIKGSVTVDPDGFPLVYTGSRDNNFRILSFDQGRPVELWRMNANNVSPIHWNNDWDASALIIDDYLFEGGENSWFYIVKLNRGYDENLHVTVDPEIIWKQPSWDDQLRRDFGTAQFSVEGGASIYDNTLYFANSAGLVQGWDISGLKDGVMPQGRRHADPGLPVLDRRRHGCLGRGRRRGLSLCRVPVREAQRPVAGGRPDDQA